MTTSATFLARLDLFDDEVGSRREVEDEGEVATVGTYDRKTVSLSTGFNALSPPTGAQGVIIRPLTGAVTWTLKGVTGDTGVKLSSLALPAFDICLPLGSGASIGIHVTGAATADVIFF